MKFLKKCAIAAAVIFPLAAAAATFSVDSNEVETDLGSNSDTNVNVEINANVNVPQPYGIKTVPPPAPVRVTRPPAPVPVPAATAAENNNANTPPPENANIPPAPTPTPTPNPVSGEEKQAASPFSSTAVGRAVTRVARAAVTVGTSVKAAAITVNEQVVQNKQVQAVNNDIVAPATTVATTAVAASVNLPHAMYFFYLLFLQPVALLDRRRRKKTGVVFNSLNKLPVGLALVRLIDRKTKRLVRTRVTDHTGRILFVVPESEYEIQVSRSGFVFPAPSLANAVADPIYGEIYKGGSIAPRGEPIAPYIPIEPAGLALTEREVIQKRGALAIKHLIASSTTVLCFISFAVSPNLWTGLNFSAQLIVLAAVERYVLKGAAKKTGRVVNGTGRPVSAVVRLFETTYNRLVETAATDPSGRFAFLVGPNKYYVIAESSGKKIKSEVFDFSAGKGEMVVAPRLVLP